YIGTLYIKHSLVNCPKDQAKGIIHTSVRSTTSCAPRTACYPCTRRWKRASDKTLASIRHYGDNRQSTMEKFRSSRAWEDHPKGLICDPYLSNEGQLIFSSEFIEPQCV